MALPTLGATLEWWYEGSTEFQYPGTTVASGDTRNPAYNDLVAVWDAYNGSEANWWGLDGTPDDWTSGIYWSATPSSEGHVAVNLSNGEDYDRTD